MLKTGVNTKVTIITIQRKMVLKLNAVFLIALYVIYQLIILGAIIRNTADLKAIIFGFTVTYGLTRLGRGSLATPSVSPTSKTNVSSLCQWLAKYIWVMCYTIILHLGLPVRNRTQVRNVTYAGTNKLIGTLQ